MGRSANIQQVLQTLAEGLVLSEMTGVGGRVMRFLTSSKNYEIWLQLVLY